MCRLSQTLFLKGVRLCRYLLSDLGEEAAILSSNAVFDYLGRLKIFFFKAVNAETFTASGLDVLLKNYLLQSTVSSIFCSPL
jgi:hypothetical protein